MDWVRHRWWLSSAAALALVCASLPAANAFAGGAPGPASANVVMAAQSYRAWAVRVPSHGNVAVRFNGANAGNQSAVFLVPLSRGNRFGTSGGESTLIEASVAGARLHETPGPDAASISYDRLPAGDYLLVVIVGGDTVNVGEAIVDVSAPAGTLLRSTSGPAHEFTDADFASERSLVVRTPAFTDESADGAISITVRGYMFGSFKSDSPSARISCTAPVDERAHSSANLCSWFGSRHGTYQLRLTDDMHGNSGWGSSSVALLADVQLP